MNPSRPSAGVDRRTLLSSLTALPAFSLPFLASAARAQSASGQGGFSFAAVGDTRPMMYLPETSGEPDLVKLFVEMFGLVMPERVAEEVVLCQEGARAPCCTRDEGGPFGAVL